MFSATLRHYMPRMKQVSDKNTKNEILTAYQELLSEVSVGGAPTMEQQEEKTVVAAASNKTVEKITEDLSKLKLSFAQAVNELTDRLTQEAETLATIQKAIAISKKELEETQKIKVNAGFLYRMLEAQKAKEKEWTEKEKTHAEETARNRSREEEEYMYEKKLLKERDADERESEKLARARKAEEEVLSRAALMKELEELRRKAAAAPAETEKAVKDSVAKAVSETQADAAVKAQFAKQQADAEFALNSAKIEGLEAMVKMQSQEIVTLKKQFEESTRQVKDIAVSVIENTRKESAPSIPQQDK